MGLSQFQIIAKLGEGSYSSVWRVKRTSDGQEYAMKKVKLASLSDKEKQNSVNEVRILASIKDSNIIGYKEAFLDDSGTVLCIVMEYAAGGDLSNRITEHQKAKTFFKEEEIWNFIVQIIRGLKTLHDMKILHRDLKSANVFLSKDGTEVKLGDLNVSKVLKTHLVYTQTGTPYYASPEIWRDQPYDMKSDIWSLGCVLYEMAALKPPFRAKDMEGLFKKVQKGVFDKLPPQYSNDLFNFISLCLKVAPLMRPTCDELLKHPILQRNGQGYLKAMEDAAFTNLLLSTIRMPKNMRTLGQVLPKPNYGKERAETEVSVKKLPRISANDSNLYLTKGYAVAPKTSAAVTEEDRNSLRHDFSSESRISNVIRLDAKPRRKIERENHSKTPSALLEPPKIRASDFNTPKENILLTEQVYSIKPSAYKGYHSRQLTKDPQVRLNLQRMDRSEDYETKLRRYSSNNTTCVRSNSIAAPVLTTEKSSENLLTNESIAAMLIEGGRILDERDITPSRFLSKQSDIVASYRNRSQLLVDEKYSRKRVADRVVDENVNNNQSKLRAVVGRHGASNRLYNHKSSVESVIRRSGDPSYCDYTRDGDLTQQSQMTEGRSRYAYLEDREKRVMLNNIDNTHSHKYIVENNGDLRKRRKNLDEL